MSAKTDPTEPNWNNLLIAGAAYLLVLFGIITLNPFVGVVLFLFSSLVALATAAVFFLRRKVDVRKETKDQGLGARLRRRLTACQRQEDKFRDEADAIRVSIEELRNDLERSTTAPAEELERGEKVLKALKAEFDLRHTKALFFADCATRLKQLLARHQLNDNIARRQKELSTLRATNFDDEAAVEETHYHLEQDSIQIETVSELSKEVGDYFKTEQAEELRQRLEKLRTKILRPTQPSDKKKS
ncbi:hypothetical protein [Neolewinella antarctica]|uniref:Signal recognition particle GTPase n=1 Tax=Neolewinella antarctica TaxID=442734 RepID=A0ABX0XH12_9BACT|nr:hypothetical protein [Neolewinella antarctica]NJC28139.1 signal recognition particle GTPase [Neolewinella antarctica]